MRPTPIYGSCTAADCGCSAVSSTLRLSHTALRGSVAVTAATLRPAVRFSPREAWSAAALQVEVSLTPNLWPFFLPFWAWV